MRETHSIRKACAQVGAKVKRKTLAEKIYSARITRKLSQQNLAALAGLGQSHISMIESGRRKNLSAQTLLALAGALGEHPAFLLGDRP